MNFHLSPHLPLPEPLRGADQGTFAERTISKRLPGIARRVVQENDWPFEIVSALLALAEEMPHGRLRPLTDGGLDAPAWEHYLSPHVGQDWLTPPWFTVETYFFRRILEATGYFQPGPGALIDPYAYQKARGLEVVNPAMQLFSERVENFSGVAPGNPESYTERLAAMLRATIWGNQADLSMWPASNEGQPTGPKHHHQPNAGMDALLCDEAAQAAENLTRPGTRAKRVDFVLDNSGVELAYDLGLADFLLSASLAQSVYLHVKPYPTYVSDATALDVNTTITHFTSAKDPALSTLGKRLRVHLKLKKLRVATHHYWVSPLAGWQMPSDLHIELGKSDLLISKGDANYRRWLGDRHWPFNTQLDKILHYLPAPWLALRILKANMAAGLSPGIPEAAAALDPHWLYSGCWGVIQFVNIQRA